MQIQAEKLQKSTPAPNNLVANQKCLSVEQHDMLLMSATIEAMHTLLGYVCQSLPRTLPRISESRA